MMTLERYSGYLILTAMAVVIVIPLLSVFLASVQPAGSLLAGLTWPSEWHWENYREAWSVAGFSTLIRSSFIVVLGVVPMTLLLATLAGYALGQLNLPGGNAVLSVFVAGLVIPVELIVIPLFFNLREVGLTNSYLGVILTEIGLFMPFGVFWTRTFFATVPRDLVEAARVDGASAFQVLRVLLPLARPSISTLGVLVFMWSWNQFLLILILIQQPSRRTAPAGLGFFVGQHTTDIPSHDHRDPPDRHRVPAVPAQLRRRPSAGRDQGLAPDDKHLSLVEDRAGCADHVFKLIASHVARLVRHGAAPSVRVA